MQENKMSDTDGVMIKTVSVYTQENRLPYRISLFQH